MPVLQDRPRRRASHRRPLRTLLDGDHPARHLEQWFFKITKYAERLLANLDWIDWSDVVKTAQRNWIGRSDGLEMSFPVEGRDEKITFFTTRPDTIFGVTFMALAPEHPLVQQVTTSAQRAAVDKYVAGALHKTAIDRQATEHSGVFTGAYATNPLNGEPVPVWVADYVLMTYGTGAIMAVPAHDERDFDFAKRYGLPIKVVVAPDGWSGGELDKAPPILACSSTPASSTARRATRPSKRSSRSSSATARAAVALHFALRDWLISRQRYWGAPIPIVYCKKCGGTQAVPETQLPVVLPYVEAFRPTGTDDAPPLASRVVCQHDLPELWRPGSTRDRRLRHVPRLVLVLPALPVDGVRRSSVR